MKIGPAMLTVTLLGTPAFADEALEHHRALWAAAALDTYVYAYQKFCECHRDEPPATHVEVRDGSVTNVFHLHADSDRRVPAREGSLDLYWTVPQLFELIENAAARELTWRASYDAELGYPTRVFIDQDPGFVGEELDVRLTSFERDPGGGRD